MLLKSYDPNNHLEFSKIGEGWATANNSQVNDFVQGIISVSKLEANHYYICS